MAHFEKVAEKKDLKPGECKVVAAGGRSVALLNVGGTFCALDNICPHQGGPLGEGLLEGETLTCPWHGWTFDVRTGACTFNPRAVVPVFQVKAEGNDVLVACD